MVTSTVFRAPARINSTAATVVHCTNLAASNTFLMVQFVDYNGTVNCTINSAAIAPLSTWTATTQDTHLFIEDEFCGPSTTIEQGMVRVLVAAGSPADVACTIQLIDPTAVTPVFATALEVYPR